jgi:hypothetical protein
MLGIPLSTVLQLAKVVRAAFPARDALIDSIAAAGRFIADKAIQFAIN